MGHTGLRQRKKAQMRQHIADTAARLFAAYGFDQVSIADVAQAVGISDQTVYNYFPSKQDLVLDRAEEISERYRQAVVNRPHGTSPASALYPLAQEDIERFRHAELDQARGEFPALGIASSSIRRFELELRDSQVELVAAAITATCPTLHPAIVYTHASALISVFQMITDHIGRCVLSDTSIVTVADELTLAAETVFNDLDSHFHTLIYPSDHNPQKQSGSSYTKEYTA
jgi:AcrR family transcriptional regulator